MKLLFLKTVRFIVLLFNLLIFNFLFQFVGHCQIKIWPGGTTVVGSTSSSGAGTKLHVVGNSTFSASNSAPTSSAYIRGLSTYSTASSPDYSWWGDEQTGLFHPTGSQIIGFSIFGTEAIRINSNRNLLIGQTTNNTGNERLQITNSSTDGRAIQLTTLNHVADFAYCQINNVNRSLSKAFEVQLSSIPKFYIRGDGTNVFPSDRRLKTDILSLENSLQKILALNCYTYKFIDEIANGNAQSRVGLIAQEVEEIIPSLVTTDDKGMKGLDYISFIPYLIGALQTQNNKIEELQTQLNNCCTPTTLKLGAKLNKEDKQINNFEENRAYIQQNHPNPFNKESVIHAFVPIGSESASILIFDLNGKLLKTYLISERNKIEIKISANEFSAGMYHYTLIVDNQEVDTKRMIITQ